MKSLITILLLMVFLNLNATNYFVSSISGNDNNAGTQAAPWKSINKINNTSLSGSDIVSFKSGETFYGTITTVAAYNTYGGTANAIITGGINVTGWVSVGSNLWEAALPNEPKVVVINGVQQAPGRYPNSGWLTISGANKSSISSNLTTKAQYIVLRMNRYVTEKLPVNSQNGSTITFTNDGDRTPEDGYGYFITGPSTLDKPLEWAWVNGKLRVYSTSVPTGVFASQLNDLVRFDTKNSASFNNITFQLAQNNLIFLDNAQNIKINQCVLQFSGLMGVWGQPNGDYTGLSITKSSISWINSDGIHLYGTASNVLIDGNSFTDCGMISGEGGANEYRAISFEQHTISNGTISNNLINRCGYNGMNVAGPNLLAKGNTILNTCKLMDDGGGIYIQDNSSTPNKRITGNIIDSVGWGAGEGTPDPESNQGYCIYSDAGNSNTEIDNNTMSHAGIGGFYMDDSKNINFHDNKLIDNIHSIKIEYQGRENGTLPIVGLRVVNNLISINSDNYLAYYNSGGGPSVKTWGTIDNNTYIKQGGGKIIYSGNYFTLPEWVAYSGFDSHSTTSGTPTPVNKPPVVSAGADAVLNYPVNSVTLNGTATDPDGTISSVKWSLAGTTIGTSNLLVLSSLSAGTYNYTFSATDNSGSTVSDGVQVVVTSAPVNQLPVANAGQDQTITLPVNSVTLTGIASDPDGTISSVKWTNSAGSVLGTNNNLSLSGLTQGTYVYTFTVTDNKGATVSDQVTVIVKPAVATRILVVTIKVYLNPDGTYTTEQQ